MNKILASIIMLTLLITTSLVFAAPEGVNIVSNTTEVPAGNPATAITTAGGSFTTLVLNGTFQNPRWKAYVGNISGALTLDDSTASTIYDWDLTVITGEVYASRSNSVSWSNMACADNATLNAEETAINFDMAKVDSINNTFNNSVHKSFMVAGQTITASTCRAIATYVNDAEQVVDENADFQQILMEDSVQIIYAGLLEQDAVGYDGISTYDFQMILPDDETSGVDTTYYFYAELG